MIDPRHVEAGVLVDDWSGLYKESWTGVIVPEAFTHPAKYSRALIRYIYQHVEDCGWIKPGDSVCDPFGGVALGGLDAMRHGLNWIGCELEEKFVGLGNQNIALWNERYSRMPKWGTARLIQGDSRQLANVLSEAQVAVTSPPYATTSNQGGDQATHPGMKWDGVRPRIDRGTVDRKNYRGTDYGSSEGQLGAMKEGDLQATLSISSPPYIGSLANAKNYTDSEKAKSDSEREFMQHRSSTYADLRYGETDGNLGAMPDGDHAIAITSPPYNPPMSQDHNGSRGGQRGTTPSETGAFVKYGNTPGQLEGLSMDGFDAAISSPPYAELAMRGGGEKHDKVIDAMKEGYGKTDGQLGGMKDDQFQAAISSPPYEADVMKRSRPADVQDDRGFTSKFSKSDIAGRFYSQEADNLGNQRGEDFWSASLIILEQLYQVIIPGGHAVFVVKAFVRDKKIVDFPGQWAQLCEAVGFRLLHDHHALLTEHYGTQQTMHGEDKHLTVARKSFFRRLAESKGSPKIDYENVLCFLRP